MYCAGQSPSGEVNFAEKRSITAHRGFDCRVLGKTDEGSLEGYEVDTTKSEARRGKREEGGKGKGGGVDGTPNTHPWNPVPNPP